MTVLLAVSASEAETARLTAGGPRRDFLELTEAVGGTVVYREGVKARGWRAKLLGPHVRQAWRVAGMARRGDVIFADGEHVGLPLLLFLAVRGRRPARVVMLGHLLSKRWKLALLWLATRAGPRGQLVLHSVEQHAIAAPRLGRRWRARLVPYQVDTAFWHAQEGVEPPGRKLVVAVGSENRDYETLTAAARGIDADVVIAAGSHWARETAAAGELPANVRYLSEPLGFAELRELYARAAVVAVPLHDVPNQSGVTTILEAMSMGVPVVVTASRGQRECVTGPLVTGDGARDALATADRGLQVLGGAAAPGATGLYVPPGDVAALRAALAQLLGDAEARAALGAAGRASAVQSFDTDRFTAALAALLETPAAREGRGVGAAAPAP
ncbi:MAG: glycosyltransferase family 4 protein [Dehalococcoidia bacterium]|nr:glycosyltransferase family 4 protein [Dehalococcoidia bacterium]